MGIKFLIYVADVMERLPYISIALSVVFIIWLISYLIACSSPDEPEQKKKAKPFYLVLLTILSTVFALLFAFLPSPEACYKIAGISAVEQSQIDAAGNIVKSQHEASK